MGEIVLVTGGSGVLGRAITQKLLERGFTVRVFDRRPPPIKNEKLEFVQGDIRDKEKVSRAVKDCKFVFHLAAALPQARISKSEFYEINVASTENLILASVENGVKRFIFASTTEVYGPQKISQPLTEDSELKFTEEYSINKYECEKMLSKYREKYGLSFVALRLPMVMGPGFYHEKSIISVMYLAKFNLPIPIPDIDIPVSFVDSEDAADAFVLSAEVQEADGHIFNISSPDNPPLEDFMKEFLRLVGSRSRLLKIPPKIFSRILDIARFLARFQDNKFFGTPVELFDYSLVGGAYSIEKARKILGYSPKYSCAQAWARTFRWFFSLPLKTQLKTFFIENVTSKVKR